MECRCRGFFPNNIVYSDFMVTLWWLYGDFMVTLWWLNGDFMVTLWWLYGDFMVTILVGGLEYDFYVSIQLGIIIPTDFHIFLRGWNHQPVSNYLPLKLKLPEEMLEP